jgi:hypothetical protein
MNLKHSIQFLPAVSGSMRFVQTIFGQNTGQPLHLGKPFMLLSFLRKIALCGVLIVGIPAAVFGQTNYFAANGSEYAIIGSLLGDQVLPDAAVTTNGGFIVWQDNITDGDGWGVSAMQLNGTLSGSGSSFRVNVQGAGDQENSRVALLPGGGAVFVWQGGVEGLNQHIYARFLSSSGTWLTTNDVEVNTFTNNFQITPAVATLANGNVVIVWASFDEAGASSLLDVYGRIFSPAGAPVTNEFLINQQYTAYNQRTPAVAALANGGFVVVWVSEQESVAAPAPGAGSFLISNTAMAPNASVGIDAQLYNGSGNTQGGEFFVNTDSNPCANPDVAAGSDGGFVVTWDARDLTSLLTNSLDIYARSFTSAGAGSGSTVLRVNTYLYGDQYAPRISALGTNYLTVWTSLAQDGSLEGVYGQFLQGNGSEIGGEFRVNTTTISSQIQPVVASDGVSQFLAVWSSFTGLPYSFDLYAQRYLNAAAALNPMAAPFVYAPFVLSNNVYQPQLVVSWPPVTGLSISDYEVYVDGGTNPAVVTTNVWTMTTAASSSHSFAVDYLTTGGGRSPLSPSASGTTWSGLNWGGIPYEWMAMYFGGYYGGAYHTNGWSSASQPPPNSPPGSPTLLQLFLSGGIPYEPTTWLQTTLSNTPQGMILSWNTQPGLTYQVQVATNLGAWSNLGSPRFAAGSNDEINVGGTPAGYYRVLLLRQ